MSKSHLRVNVVIASWIINSPIPRDLLCSSLEKENKTLTSLFCIGYLQSTLQFFNKGGAHLMLGCFD
ncbi:unnamed protein product [Lathyrus oleraceus]